MKWTLRKSGEVWADARVGVRYPGELKNWLAENTSMKQPQIEEWLRSRLADLLDDWKQVAVLSGQVTFISVEDDDTEYDASYNGSYPYLI